MKHKEVLFKFIKEVIVSTAIIERELDSFNIGEAKSRNKILVGQTKDLFNNIIKSEFEGCTFTDNQTWLSRYDAATNKEVVMDNLINQCLILIDHLSITEAELFDANLMYPDDMKSDETLINLLSLNAWLLNYLYMMIENKINTLTKVS